MYGKFFSALAATLAAWLLAALTGDEHISALEAVNGLLLVLSAVGVVIVPNLTGTVGKYSKLVVYSLTAGATLLVTGGGALLDGGITITEWLQVMVAALAGVGVVGFNSPKLAVTGHRVGEQHP